MPRRDVATGSEGSSASTPALHQTQTRVSAPLCPDGPPPRRQPTLGWLVGQLVVIICALGLTGLYVGAILCAARRFSVTRRDGRFGGMDATNLTHGGKE